MTYKKVSGTMKTDTIDIQGWGTDYDSCPVGQWQPFNLCIYGLVDPELHPVKFLEQVSDYLDDELYKLRSMK